MIKRRALALAATSIAISSLLAACGGAGTASSSAPAGSSSAAQVTAEGSDADIAFAQGMIPHHMQAVEMADLALARPTSPGVKALAEQIKAAQGPEIEMMSGWLKQWGAPMDMADEHSGHDMGGMEMTGMMTDEDMTALAAASGADFDRMWLTMMIAHHEGAIKMADGIKAESSNPEVTALADAVVAGQTTEIATMRTMMQ